MKTMKDYCDLYLKCDVLLLSNVKFSNKCPKSYGLCPSHYLAGPVLSWKCLVCKKLN